MVRTSDPSLSRLSGGPGRPFLVATVPSPSHSTGPELVPDQLVWLSRFPLDSGVRLWWYYSYFFGSFVRRFRRPAIWTNVSARTEFRMDHARDISGLGPVDDFLVYSVWPRG